MCCNKIVGRKIIIFIVTCFLLALAGVADAHRDDYINETLVYGTLEQSEVEGEYWFDYGYKSNRRGGFLRHNIAAEWGITDHWMVDIRTTLKKKTGDNPTFDSGRIESRYRLFNEGDLPVDVAISWEINWKRLENGSVRTGIEPRLILSRDFNKKLNITFNLSDEIPLDSSQSAMQVALGFRYNWNDLTRLGSELQYDTFEHMGSVIPQMWFALPDDIALKIGYSIGLDRNNENFARVALEVEF